MDPEEQHREAIRIAAELLPGHDPHASCMLVASALAGMRKLPLSRVRVGALIHRTWFNDEAAIAIRGGWGVDGVDWQAGRLYLTEPHVDEDGGFNGHTWLEDSAGEVSDALYGYEGPRRCLDADWLLQGLYVPVRKLESLVKAHWGPLMRQAREAGREIASAAIPFPR